jgi:tRNA (cmo5U34)-methyltransferase
MPKEARDNLSSHPAGVYDGAVRSTIPYYDCLHQETCAWVRVIRPDVREWLDTGCGTGTLVARCLPVFPEARFTLADPSPQMLSVARQRLRDRVHFLDPCASGELPLELRGSFQVLTAIQCHHYLNGEGRRAATERCFQMLAPDGAFITFENVRPATEQGMIWGRARWRDFQIEHGKSPEDADGHLARLGTEFFPISLDAHLELLQQTGFRTVELLWKSCLQAGFVAVK